MGLSGFMMMKSQFRTRFLFSLATAAALLLPCQFTYADMLASIDIDAPLNADLSKQLETNFKQLQVTKQDVRTYEVMEFALVRIEDKRYCVGPDCLTLVLNKNTSQVLTTAFLPKHFVSGPNTPRFFYETITLQFKNKPPLYLVLGHSFAGTLTLGN